MNTLVWIAAGVAVLVAALLLARAWLGAGAERRGALPAPQGWVANGLGDMASVRLAREDLRVIRDDIQGLHVLREDIRRVAGLLERILEETMVLQQARVSPPRPQPLATARDTVREPRHEHAPEPSPVRGGGWPPDSRDPDLRVQRDESDWGGDPKPHAAAPGGAAWSAPAASQPHEPSSRAEPVEARNDAVVASERHPPEAWLERKSGEAEVWLNARVTLTDAALQRWSTFYDWERREPGARYNATRPARVTSSGSVVSKGVARPL